MIWWMWLLAGFVLLLIELLTPGGFYFLFFGVGAIFVGLLAALGLAGPVWLQWLFFSVTSVLALVFFREPLREKIRSSSPTGDVDSLIGETAVALVGIDVDEIGKAELRGTSWNVRNVGTNAVVAGQRCKVERVDGLMLWIRG